MVYMDDCNITRYTGSTKDMGGTRSCKEGHEGPVFLPFALIESVIRYEWNCRSPIPQARYIPAPPKMRANRLSNGGERETLH